ncbi:MAG TPA: hypothetical protein VFR07_18320 [Mycobacteriales bacterium]|nr:hypothetical protein [Mycobacteriales bacterium]
MLVDLVLAGNGAYWRKRVEMSRPPPRGQSVVLLEAPVLVGVVVGSATPFDGDGNVASVLLRAAPEGPPAALQAGLRRDGWRPLL